MERKEHHRGAYFNKFAASMAAAAAASHAGKS